MHDILVVVPTYNERENVARLLPAIRSALPDADVLVVDDNSPDQTAQVVQQLSTSDRQFFLLSREGKAGYGKAVTAGLEWGLARSYSRLIQMDADFSHDPRFLPALLGASEKCDLVLGSRYVRGGGTVNWGLGRRILSRGGNAYARTVLGLRVRDLTGGFRCWRRELLQKIDLGSVRASGYSFMIETLYRATRSGAKICEVPIIFAERIHGQSKMSRRIIIEAMLLVALLKLRRRPAR